jgi:hypothetical protein
MSGTFVLTKDIFYASVEIFYFFCKSIVLWLLADIQHSPLLINYVRMVAFAPGS